MRQIPMSLAVLLFTPCLLAPARADDFPLPEYDQAVDKYLSSLANLSVEISSVSESPEQFRDSITYSVASIPKYFRVECKIKREDLDGTKKVETKEVVELLRPDGYYLLSKDENSRFQLRKRIYSVPSPLSLYNVSAESGILCLLSPLCKTGGAPIGTLLRGQTELEVTCAKFNRGAITEAGPIVLDTTDRSLAPNNQWVATCSYQLNPDWLITHSELKGSQGGFTLTDIEYTDFNGLKLPSRLTSRRGGSIRKTDFQVDFRNYRRFDGTPDDFSFARYGLPEIDRPHRSVWRRQLPFWCLLAAAGCGAYFALRYWYYRSRNVGSATP